MKWCSYKIKKRLFRTDGNIFVPVKDGIAHDWGIDFDENPRSVLFLMHYLKWNGQPPINITGAEISVLLNESNLNIFGGYITFWVTSIGQRWHLERHNSWTKKGITPSIDLTLKTVHSFGFAFIGWDKMPMGQIILKEFKIL
ncbi:hypothetical protein LCGC14_3015510 [marine sediment metagenome]|uniref:Uncharacterized protein n=1 Tax=marine sediment metagenome TaxID=412755 RepID=A0A0F8XJP4_9ZZZZ